ncbi:ATP-dependent Clp protease proteolytic subunit [Patescibacteria group bacterium]|nr:ATP-dependent Clp protease proteolytic subunit [Patescibacteria group bacterium]
MINTKDQVTIINFVAGITDKTASLLMFLLTEQLRSGVSNFRINISSTGGMVFHAVSVFNFLNGLRNVHLHTHNLGQIDSGANLIFLAGQERTASKSSSFLLHQPELTIQGQGANFSIDFLKERIESLEKDEAKMAEIIADKIGKTQQEVLQMFKSRKTYSSSEAKDLKFITQIEEFVAEPGMPIFTITNQA